MEEFESAPLDQNSTQNTKTPIPETKHAYIDKIILIAIFVILVFTTYFALFVKQPKRQIPVNQSISPVIEKPSQEINKPEEIIVISAEALAFHKPQLIKQFEDDEATYEFYKVGNVLEGDYKGYEIVKGKFQTTAGPCKGPGCGKPFFIRYLKKDRDLIHLALNSELTEIKRWGMDPTKIADWNFTLNNELTLEPFNLPKETNYNGGTIKYVKTEEGLPNNNTYIVYTDPILGQVYTTKESVSPQEPFYSGEETAYETTGKWGDGVDSCYNEECFFSNGLFVFHPDETFSIYTYKPVEFSYKILANEKTYNITDYEGEYYFKTRNGCSGNDADYISIASPSNISISDLEEVGSFSQGDKRLLFFNNTEHSYLTHFYEKYKLYFPELEQMRIGGEKNLTFKTFEDFAASYPVLFFEDDFGRLVRLTHKEFVIPYACEPIIYLYPEQETEISIKLDTNLVELVGSKPEYNTGWAVTAFPSGKIIDQGNNIYPYIFWEGTLKYLPEKNDGFVVKKENVEISFKKTLPKLGLNEQETIDFIKAWTPKLKVAPYYFITFHNTKTVNIYAPLNVQPTPTTVIRILMEYKPLNEYTEVAPFKYDKTPQRNGFTLVEWGGIER